MTDMEPTLFDRDKFKVRPTIVKVYEGKKFHLIRHGLTYCGQSGTSAFTVGLHFDQDWATLVEEGEACKHCQKQAEKRIRKGFEV